MVWGGGGSELSWSAILHEIDAVEVTKVDVIWGKFQGKLERFHYRKT